MLETLEENGWKIQRCDESALKNDFHKRYPTLPEDFLNFISSFRTCTDKQEQQWFISVYDYFHERVSGEVFRWNEYEKMSIEATGDDQKLKMEIEEFWLNYLPFFMATHSDYSYFAICLNGENIGKIVQGFAPEFEEIEYVAESFSEFKSNILDMIKYT